MTSPKCPDTQHRFAKFDDATIFCQRCGEQRVMDVQKLIAQLPQPIYLPCPGPHYTPWQWPNYTPWRPTYPVVVYSTDTVTVGDIGGTTTVSDGLVIT